MAAVVDFRALMVLVMVVKVAVAAATPIMVL